MATRKSRRQLSFSTSTTDKYCCKLCQEHHCQLSSPAEWRDDQARNYVLSLKVPVESLVCQPCRHDVKRVLANPDYTPKWRKSNMLLRSGNTRQTCYILDCAQEAFVCTSLGSSVEMKHAFDNTGLIYSKMIPTPTPLRKLHCYQVYNVLHAINKQCATLWIVAEIHFPPGMSEPSNHPAAPC